jgi:imidazolonepropionase-like amidohydrolase
MKALESIDVNSEQGQKIVGFFKEHGTVIDPTIALMEWTGWPYSKPYSDVEPGAKRVALELQETINSTGVPAAQQAMAKLNLEKRLAIIGALHKAGVTIVAGTDQTVPGFSVYREIELYQQAGFTPLEALQAATAVPARVMKMEKETGTVEAGKRADFDVLDANPLEDIHNVRTMRLVVASGVVYEPGPVWGSVGFEVGDISRKPLAVSH